MLLQRAKENGEERACFVLFSFTLLLILSLSSSLRRVFKFCFVVDRFSMWCCGGTGT